MRRLEILNQLSIYAAAIELISSVADWKRPFIGGYKSSGRQGLRNLSASAMFSLLATGFLATGVSPAMGTCSGGLGRRAPECDPRA